MSAADVGHQLMLDLNQADATRKSALSLEQKFRYEQRAKQKDKADCRKVVQQRLRALLDQTKEAEKTWKSLLHSLPNYVDTEIFRSYPTFSCRQTSGQKRKPPRKSTSPLAVDQNLSYELCLYERIGPSTVSLSYNGIQLTTAMSKYFITSLSKERLLGIKINGNSINMRNLPYNQHLQRETLDLFVQSVGDQIPTNSLEEAPAWMSVLSSSEGTLPTNNSFLDWQLPHSILLTGPLTPDRELLSKFFLGDTVPANTPSWLLQLASDQYLQALVIAGPSLEADSRPLQRKLIDKWMEMLSCLVSPELGDSSVHLHIRALPPSELRDFESSRLMIQASYTSGLGGDTTITSSKQSTRVLTLCSVSNFEDYLCFGFKHRTTSEPLHTLLLEAAPMSLISDWMVHALGTKTCPIQIPTCLRSWMDKTKLARVRQVVSGKNGKRSIQYLAVQKKEATPKPAISSLPLTPTTHASAARSQQIKEEAMSCPFDFLPFYK